MADVARPTQLDPGPARRAARSTPRRGSGRSSVQTWSEVADADQRRRADPVTAPADALQRGADAATSCAARLEDARPQAAVSSGLGLAESGRTQSRPTRLPCSEARRRAAVRRVSERLRTRWADSRDTDLGRGRVKRPRQEDPQDRRPEPRRSRRRSGVETVATKIRNRWSLPCPGATALTTRWLRRFTAQQHPPELTARR